MITLSPFQWSSFNFFGFYCAYGVLLPFLPVWLKHHGYDTEMIGLLISLGYLFRFSGAMFFSKQIRHPNQLINLNRFLTWVSIAILCLVAWSASSIWLLLPMIMLFHIFNGGAMSISDTIASIWQQQAGMDYGKSRLFGSMAFVVGSVSTGYLLGWLGESAVIGIAIGWLVFLGCGLSLNPTRLFEEKQAEKTDSSVGFWQILKQPTTFRMILAVSLIQASHAAYYAYSTIHWTSNGISTQQASLLWGLAVCAEICFFFFSNRFFKTWNVRHLMLISALATMLRWAILASTTHIFVMAALQLLHSLSYGMGHYAMIRYISTQPTAQIPQLQALYFGSAGCMLMALFTFVAGFVYQTSPSLSFWLMFVFALPAIIIVPKKMAVKV